MKRRQFLTTLGAGLAAQSLDAASRPNVLFIAIDDLNDWIGCLGGHPQSKTPNFDRLAARGVLFTNAHCAAPLCNPSRAALMTGITPATSGVYENNQPWRKAPALAKAVTIPQYFRANGYKAIGSGKTYHDAFPDPQSWDEYFPSLDRQKPPDPKPAKTPVNGIPNTAHFDWGPLDPDAKDGDMGDSKVADWVIGQMSKQHGKPLFLACGLFRPHLPWYVPRKYFDMHPVEKIELPSVRADDLDDVPPIGVAMAKPNGDHKKVIEHNQWKQAVQGYLASISFCDAMLGRVLDAFDKSPLAKDTIVMLWSDHGWHLGEKLHWRKFSLWEEATHNVFMVVAPGVTKPAGRCDRTVSLMDVYPTLIDLCGLSQKSGLEGKSLLPLLKDPKAKWDRPAVTTFRKGNHGVRSERWRYIRYHDGTEELYDHNVDPMEWTNLASKPESAAVKKELAKWLPKVNAEPSLVVKGAGEEN